MGTSNALVPEIALAGCVAFVTGAGSGIGRATAQRLGQSGAKVALVGRTPKEREAAADEIRRAGGEALTPRADVANSDQLAEAFTAATKE